MRRKDSGLKQGDGSETVRGGALLSVRADTDMDPQSEGSILAGWCQVHPVLACRSGRTRVQWPEGRMQSHKGREDPR